MSSTWGFLVELNFFLLTFIPEQLLRMIVRQKLRYLVARHPILTTYDTRSNVVLKMFSPFLLNQRSLRDSTISHGVCVGEMLVSKAICDALTH